MLINGFGSKGVFVKKLGRIGEVISICNVKS